MIPGIVADELRATLLDYLDTVGRCARVIAKETRGFGDVFRLRRRSSDQSVLTTDRAFAQEAAKSTG